MSEETESTPANQAEAIVIDNFEDAKSLSSSSDSSLSELENILQGTKVFSHFSLLEDNEELNEALPKTKNELLPEELPFVEETFPLITPDFEIRRVGRLSTFVESFLVIESFEAEPVLDIGSLIVFEDRNPVGRVFDVFGPVKQPCYSILVRTDSEKLKECVGKSVFFVVEYSRFVDTNSAYMKGSDASWYNDEEIPIELQDFSDDESERKSSKARKGRVGDKDASKRHTKTSRNLETNSETSQGSTEEQYDWSLATKPENAKGTETLQKNSHFPTRTLPSLVSLQISKSPSSIPGLTRKSS
ncbi:uncharacterized protein Gasu_08650 [Galdieria sulphuraria]|uniref:H/ACA ribonucleoprotein complex subunit n=1 Tax=Galdieria sulphuraria TaxID=130081 RepID=M2X5M3_GALSU|nr:uncharacterized protein Gasu_08650 [Galdieria sulphuraria]EME31785.1 hypothetical protein Gasu_08650 [Galdieria sulphuraria]|eukprot:XP_005708305.1 hypothetical protein Gasu_08650 [Galdieria sulphuraria]